MKVILGQRIDDKGPVVLDPSWLSSHLHVMGKTGMRKTMLMANLAVQLIELGFGVIIVDSFGGLVEEIKKRIPDQRVEDVILFEARNQEHPFALNPLSPPPTKSELNVRASQDMSMFQLLCDDGEWNSRVRQALRNILMMLYSRGEDFELLGRKFLPAPDEISAVLTMHFADDTKLPWWKQDPTSYRDLFYGILREQGQSSVFRYFELFDKMLTLRPRAEIIAALSGNVDQMLSNPLVRNIVCQETTRLEFQQVIDERKILLADLSGIGDDNAWFLGSVLMARLTSAAFARRRAELHSVVMADEFHRYATEAFRKLCEGARQYGMGIVGAQQDEADLRAWQRGIMASGANKIYFQLAPEDAVRHAREFDCTPPPGETEFKPRYRGYAERSTYWQREARLLIANADSPRKALLALEGDGVLAPGALNSLIGWLQRMRRCVEAEPAEKIHAAIDAKPLSTPERLLDALVTYAEVLEDDGYVDVSPGPLLPILEQIESYFRLKTDPQIYIQERVVTPDTPGVSHWSTSESQSASLGRPGNRGSSSSTSYSSETGTVFERVEGRRRTFADRRDEIANELTQLPRRVAKAKLFRLEEATLEATLFTADLPEENQNWEANWKSIVRNSQEMYTRPVDEVDAYVRERDELMSRAVEMWHAHRHGRETNGQRPYDAHGERLGQ